MGFERAFQSLPVDHRLIERARDGRESGEALCLAPHFFHEHGRPSPGPASPASQALLRAVRELLARDTGLATRNCFLDKRWDQIHYLLSARYRGRPPEPDDAFLDVAIEGEAPIAEHVVGTQGFPIRHTSDGTVTRIADVLARLDVESLRRHYDLAAMEERGIYKAFAGRESDADWQYLATLVRELQTFYAAAASAGDCVLVLTD
jgi:hypothetical protein